jgi:bacteriorhodopsin
VAKKDSFMIPELNTTQYQLALSMLNMTIAIMGGASLLFILLRGQVASAYQMAINLMAVVVIMAAYHYLRIYINWEASYALKDGIYVPTGVPLNYSYRYADWLGTVPLILSAVVLVLDLGRDKSRSLVTRLVLAAVVMIATGYVGEVERTDMTVRAIWGFVSTLPFVYILFVLWSELSNALSFESPRVQGFFNLLRWMLFVSWGFYPIVYMLPMFNLSGSSVTMAVQVGNSIADITAKAVFGLVIYAIAREKTDEAQRREQTKVRQAAQPQQQPAQPQPTQPVPNFPRL